MDCLNDWIHFDDQMYLRKDDRIHLDDRMCLRKDDRIHLDDRMCLPKDDQIHLDDLMYLPKDDQRGGLRLHFPDDYWMAFEMDVLRRRPRYPG